MIAYPGKTWNERLSASNSEELWKAILSVNLQTLSPTQRIVNILHSQLETLHKRPLLKQTPNSDPG